MDGKILLVDDEKSVRTSLGDYLQRDGFQVELAVDGEDAIEQLGRFEPDLVILDVKMPAKDGLEVCRAIRKQAGYTPIIMMSGAKREVLDKVVGLEVGADKYITKPFEPALLLAETRALLRIARATASGKAEAQNMIIDSYLRIDRQRREVQASNSTPHLSPLEFDLLIYLLDRSGKPCSRDDLIEFVWQDKTGAVSDRAVNTCIGRLRKKIEPDPEHPVYLLSVHGWGYKFRELF